MEEKPDDIFATGTLTITNLSSADNDRPSDVYEVIWVLEPKDPSILGYVDNTAMLFNAVGMAAHDQSQLILAWDNANYARAFSQSEQEYLQYGIHGTQVAMPASE